jgi:hypothetical protein
MLSGLPDLRHDTRQAQLGVKPIKCCRKADSPSRLASNPWPTAAAARRRVVVAHCLQRTSVVAESEVLPAVAQALTVETNQRILFRE